MVLITKRDAINRHITKRNKIFKVVILGIACIIVPVLIIVVDPIQVILNYNLQLRKGSRLYNLLKSEIKAVRWTIYLFNITNVDKFRAGEDPKLRVEEVGPFVFQEYRWYENLEESEDGQTMAMSPRFRTELILEDSIADPKDVYLSLPNLPLLVSASVFANYPSLVKFMFSSIASQMNGKAIVNVSAHDILWGYETPLLTLCNKLAPGFVYFDKLGLLERLYDNQIDYKVMVGTKGEDRFKIKSVQKIRKIHNADIDDVQVSEQTYEEDTYEGVGYPPNLMPGSPIGLYRVGVCRTIDLEYLRTDTMDNGGEGLVYGIDKGIFKRELNPITNKYYPYGVLDISQCYYGLPYVVSKSYFQDADPKLREGIDGMNPDNKTFINEITIDRKVGITFNSELSVQLSLVLDDITFNKEVGILSNTVIPITRVQLDQAKWTPGITIVFYIVHRIAPYFLICLEVVLFIVGLALLANASRSIYFNWSTNNKTMIFETAKDKRILKETLSGTPLIGEQIRRSSLID